MSLPISGMPPIPMGGMRYKWLYTPVQQELITAISQRYALSPALAEVVCNRGYDSLSLPDYLFTDRSQVHDPRLLKGAVAAVERIMRAIQEQEKILVVGDYDVDGITSTSLVIKTLKNLGAACNFFIPHRTIDGYGINVSIVERAIQNNYKVIITVDNGITALEAAQAAHDGGIDLIITDHHQPKEILPCASVIVNPHQPGCEYPFKKLAGVGVAFKVMSLLVSEMGAQLDPLCYELLLLGTVADVVSLTGENRYWVRYGLQELVKSRSLPIQMLCENMGITKTLLTSQDIGYSIAPQLNALGRLEDPRQGVLFFLSDDELFVRRTAKVLFELNSVRKEYEKSVVAHIESEIAQGIHAPHKDLCVIAANNGWRPGVVGLAAARIVSAYNVPVIVLHESSDGIVKGSCRSPAHCDIFAVLSELSQYLVSFGGHAAAAGVSLHKELLPAFKEAFSNVVARYISPADLQPVVTIDAQVSLEQVRANFLRELRYLEPFGAGNTQPVFCVPNILQLEPPTIVKDEHLKCTFADEGYKRSMIFFGCASWHEQIMQWYEEQRACTVVAYVSENEWRGNTYPSWQGLDITAQ